MQLPAGRQKIKSNIAASHDKCFKFRSHSIFDPSGKNIFESDRIVTTQQTLEKDMAAATPVPFIGADLPLPVAQPETFDFSDDEPPFDAALHLAIVEPETVTLLDASVVPVAAIPTAGAAGSRLAFTCPFKLLSEEGMRVLRHIVSREKVNICRGYFVLEGSSTISICLSLDLSCGVLCGLHWRSTHSYEVDSSTPSIYIYTHAHTHALICACGIVSQRPTPPRHTSNRAPV